VKPILADLGLRTLGDERAWAVTSPDDRYRYVLGRMWDDYFFEREDWLDHTPPRHLWAVCMLNPSKARHDVNDHTITKLTEFAKRHGAGGFVVVNLFAYSATDPKDMVRAAQGENVRGEYNDQVLRWASSRPALLGRNIAAWGKIPPKLRTLATASRWAFQTSGDRVECWGLNADSSPRHPLMLAYETPLLRMSEAQDALRAGFKNGIRPGDEAR
jgi:hypothetical protein